MVTSQEATDDEMTCKVDLLTAACADTMLMRSCYDHSQYLRSHMVLTRNRPHVPRARQQILPCQPIKSLSVHVHVSEETSQHPYVSLGLVTALHLAVACTFCWQQKPPSLDSSVQPTLLGAALHHLVLPSVWRPHM